MLHLAQPSFPKLSDAIIEPVKGRGYGKFVEGEPITQPSQVRVGDLLCDYSVQFNAINLVWVTKTDWPEEPDSLKGKKFYAAIVDPKDPSKFGMGTHGDDICFWDHEFNPSHPVFHYILHRAILSNEPQRRLELQASDFKTAVEASNTPEGRRMLEWFASRNGSRFMLSGTNPVARIIEIEQRKPGFIPLMVEHRIA